MSQLNLGKVVGRGVQSFSKTKTEGLTDSYTMAYTDGTSSEIEITHNSKNNYDDSAVAEVAKIANKVDKVDGKGLSTNDLTNELKASYDGAVTKATNADNKVNDINVLGWVVPDACPIKNYTDSDGVFHQRVGRVDLGSLEWGIWNGKFTFNINDMKDNTLNIYCNKYPFDGNVSGSSVADKCLSKGSSTKDIYIGDSSYSTADAFKNANTNVYIYYELATEITKKIDGNEAVVDVDKNLSDYGMDNKFDGRVTVGYWDTDNTKKSRQNSGISYKWVSNTNIIKVNGGELVKIKTEKVYDRIILIFWDSNDNNVYYKYVDNTNELVCKAPISCTQIGFDVRSETVDTLGHIGVYIDSNIEKIGDSLSSIGKCKNLLNPTLATTTINGVTCTNNGDGTYTLNGTASDNAKFVIVTNINLKNGYKIIGAPAESKWNTCMLKVNGAGTAYSDDLLITQDKGSYIWIEVVKDYTCNNVIFKPMLTTNLNATYDDFVPYTGSGDTLMADVASVKSVANNVDGITWIKEDIVYTCSTTDYELIETIEIPANSICSIGAWARFANTQAKGVIISASTELSKTYEILARSLNDETSCNCVTGTVNPKNIYIYAKWNAVGKNSIMLAGFIKQL